MHFQNENLKKFLEKIEGETARIPILKCLALFHSISKLFQWCFYYIKQSDTTTDDDDDVHIYWNTVDFAITYK